MVEKKQMEAAIVRILVAVYTQTVVEQLIVGDAKGATVTMETFYKDLLDMLTMAGSSSVNKATTPSDN
jgi:hypothetical protein